MKLLILFLLCVSPENALNRVFPAQSRFLQVEESDFFPSLEAAEGNLDFGSQKP